MWSSFFLQLRCSFGNINNDSNQSSSASQIVLWRFITIRKSITCLNVLKKIFFLPRSAPRNLRIGRKFSVFIAENIWFFQSVNILSTVWFHRKSVCAAKENKDFMSGKNKSIKKRNILWENCAKFDRKKIIE